MKIFKTNRIIDLTQSDQQRQDDRNKLKIYTACTSQNNYVQKLYQPSYIMHSQIPLLKNVNNYATHNQKVPSCRICCKKVENDNKKFKCQNCKKSFHIACMTNNNQCPRCKYNSKIKMSQKPFTPQKNLANLKNKKIINQIKIGEQEKSAKSQEHNMCQVLKLKVLPQVYQNQVNEFKKNYEKYIDKNGDIKIPIQDSLINKYGFLKHLLKEKIQAIPEYLFLPAYFQNLLTVWNTFSFFQPLIIPQQICKNNIQYFEQALKKNSITYFVVPLLQFIFQVSNKYVSLSLMFKIFQDLKQTGMFKYVAKYFWTVMLLELLKHQKHEQDSKYMKMIQKLQSMFDKRVYQVDNLEQKLQILTFIIHNAEKSPNFRTYVNDFYRNKGQNMALMMDGLKQQHKKIKQRQKQLNEKQSIIIQKLNQNKYDSLVGVKKSNISQINQWQNQKSQNTKLLDKIKSQIKQFKKDKETVQFLSQISLANNISFLGKDRQQKLYWYIPNTQANDIIFVSQKNQKSEQDTYTWGFYHGRSVQILLSTLNSAGMHQRKLKQNIQKMIYYALINPSSSKKVSNGKLFYLTFHFKKFRSETVEGKQVVNFLQDNIKDINLSQLRKILIQSYRVYNKLFQQGNKKLNKNEIWQQKIKNQKLKNLNGIKNLILQFTSSLYSPKIQTNKKTINQIQQIKPLLWKKRGNIYANWKKKLQQCNKNTQVFLLTLIFYFQIVYAGKPKDQILQPNKTHSKLKKIIKKSSSLSNKSKSQSQRDSQSWSGSLDNLNEQFFLKQ